MYTSDMHKPVDISGQRFGKLVAIEVAGKRKYLTMWRCVCDCGNETVAYLSNLRAGKTKSCGCGVRIHGHSTQTTPTYSSWHSMKQRCLRPRAKDLPYYAHVTVCERWLTFANFLADMGERPPGTSIDRIDNARGYEPGNCRWATHSVQMQNRRKKQPLAA
jgi:hypothetical protein